MKEFELYSGNITDIGLNPNRESNQDYYGMYKGDFGDLYLVCDGMGGQAGGDKASKLAVEAIKQVFLDSVSEDYAARGELIQKSIEFAQASLLAYASEHPEMKGMGTTLVLLLIADEEFWYANVGDSRIYLNRAKRLVQLTHDHSELQDKIDAGIVTAEEARDLPRNVITKALGHSKYEPDITGPIPLEPGDIFLLCTDGLHQYFESEQEVILLLMSEPQEACENMVRLAKERGGSDNITLQIVKVSGKASRHSFIPPGIEIPKAKKEALKIPKQAIYIGLGLVALVILGLLWSNRPAPKPKPPKTAVEAQVAETEQPPAPKVDFSSIIQELDAREPRGGDAHYVKLAQDVSRAAGKGPTRLLFFDRRFSDESIKRVTYILPDEAILLLHPNSLANSFNLTREQVQYLIVIAVSIASQTAPTEAVFDAASSQALTEPQIQKARELLATYQRQNTEAAFKSDQFERVTRSTRAKIKTSGTTLVLD